MTGGTGNDVYRVNNTHDVVIESAGGGEDMVQSSVSYTLGANVEDITLSNNTDINATGNGLDNLMVGNNGNNVMLGLGGDDVIRAGAGDDTVEGGDGDDNMDGGNGTNDTVSYANAGAGVTVNLTLTSFQNTGGAGFDKLVNFENVTGSGSDDTLIGTSGRNVITGGGGADTMTGGAGIDTFVYKAAADSAFGHADTITDLANSDKIDLSAIANDFVLSSSFHGTAHEIVLTYNSGTNITTIAIDMNGDGDASDAGDMQISLTGDHHTFTNFVGVGP
jgi:Ca2+-binding RTX toxin-like protein